MGRALGVGAAAALLVVLLYYTALAWAIALRPEVLTTLLLLLADVGIGAAAGHAAVSLTGAAARAWPAVVVAASTGTLLLGWGPDADLMHPLLSPALAAAGAAACMAVGGWLGLVLPNPHRSAAPPAVLADQPTVELRILPTGSTARAPRPGLEPAAAGRRTATEPADFATGAPEILDFGS